MSGFDNADPAFGTDGVRARALSDLSPEFALRIGRAVARILPERRMFIAHDPRVSGPILEAALSAGLAAEGVDIELLGMLPTPAIAAVSARESVPGIIVTASHNPYSDNGIKVFAAGGRKLSDEAQFAIESELENLRTESVRETEATGGSITRRLDA
ncbi:MAG: phosphoglucosamine mutase, partial [Actinomycetota bacterium]